MKAFITLAVFCLIANALASPHDLTDEQKAKVKVHFEECIKQENVSEEEVARLRKKDYANPTQNMKCFGTCIFEKVGTLKDGVLQEKVIVEKLTPQLGEEKVKNFIEKCKNTKGANRCDTGYKLYECFQNAKK